MGGFLLLQLGHVSKSSADVTSTQLAVATRGDGGQTASRGSRRTSEVDLTVSTSTPPGLVASVVDPNMVTTTTVPPTTTTTAPPATTTTTRPVAVVTTTTAKPKPSSVLTAATKPAANAPPPVSSSGDEVWARLARCESGMRNDAGAPYFGYFQFSAGTWHSIGGTGLPNDHTYDEQLVLAKKLQARSVGASGLFAAKWPCAVRSSIS